jgi:hypothetical protein
LGGNVLAEPPSLASSADPVLARFPIATDGDLLLVPVTLKGRNYRFLLDTGATNTIYDSSLRQLLGDAVGTAAVETVDRRLSVPAFKAPDARLGKLRLAGDSPVLCADLRSVRDASGHEVSGVVGMDFLRRHVFRLDPDRGEVLFLASPGPEPGKRVPVALAGGCPEVEALLPGLQAPEWFQVDTGCVGLGTGDLTGPTFDALAAAGTLRTVGDSAYQAMTGAGVERRGRLASLTVAGNHHKALLFGESRVNCLGVNYWTRYVVTFDFANEVLYLKKCRQYDKPDVQDLSGLVLNRVGGTTLVKSVHQGSPGDAAGVRPGDVIAKVGNKDAGALRLQELHLLLCSQGKRVAVILRRRDKEVRANLTLRDWRQPRPDPR